MQQIPLTQGQVAMVDDSDYEMLMQWKWCARYSPATRSFYAQRGDCSGVKQKTISMARFIMDADNGQEVDHEDHRTLNNQRHNLRLTSRQGNRMNLRQRSDNASGFCGVNWFKGSKKWRARIAINGKRVSLGLFSDKADAIAARQAANIQYGFHPNHGKVFA